MSMIPLKTNLLNFLTQREQTLFSEENGEWNPFGKPGCGAPRSRHTSTTCWFHIDWFDRFDPMIRLQRVQRPYKRAMTQRHLPWCKGARAQATRRMDFWTYRMDARLPYTHKCRFERGPSKIYLPTQNILLIKYPLINHLGSKWPRFV